MKTNLGKLVTTQCGKVVEVCALRSAVQFFVVSAIFVFGGVRFTGSHDEPYVHTRTSD